MLSVCLSNHHSMKTYGGVEVQFRALSTSALDGVEYLASGPDRIIPGTH
jgi:hypothetical protein